MIGLLLYIVIVVVLGWLAIWALGQLAPGHPALIDRVIWILVVLVVLLVIARALGLSDVAVPRV